jgi:hypothetical protein
VLSSTASGQLQSQHEYQQHQYDNTGQNKGTTKTKKNGSLQVFNTQTRVSKNMCKFTNCISG